MAWTLVRMQRPGLYVLTAGLAGLIAGFLLARPILASFGGMVLMGLAASFVRASLRAAVLRSFAASASLSFEDRTTEGKVHVAGRPIRIAIRFGDHVPDPRAIRLAVSGALGVDEPGAGAPAIPPPLAARSAVRCLRPACAGPHAVLGVHCLLGSPRAFFGIEAFAPATWRFQALPRAAARPRRVPIAAAKLRFRTAEGAITSVRAGSGIELRELRELLPGDSFRSIDWKASARFGKLIVRERDSDVTLSTYLVLDASSTMRAGVPGRRSLDQAVEVAYAMAQSLSRMRDSVGALVVDGERVHGVRATSGHRGLVRVSDTLLAAFAPPTSPDLLGELDEETGARMERYLAHTALWGRARQDDPLERGGLDGLDASLCSPGALAEHLAHLVPPGDPRSAPWQDEPAWSDVRPALHAFAASAGLTIPRSATDAPGSRDAGLLAAFRRILAEPGGPHTAVVLSDLRGIEDAQALAIGIKQLRRHGHQMLFALVDASLAGPTPSRADLEAAVRLLLHVEAHVARADDLKVLAQAGALIQLLAV